MHRAAVLLLPILALLSAPARATDPDPVELARQSSDTARANAAKSSQYAFRERQVYRYLDRDGKQSGGRIETWDVIGLEGSTYRKLILRNDQLLPPKEQKREDERLQKEVERRRRETSDERRRRVFSYHVSFSYDRILDLYDLRYLGEEAIAGRPTQILEGTPKPQFQPKTDDEKESLNYQLKVWLAPPDYALVRIEREVVGDRSRMQKGSLLRMDFLQHEDGVWLAKSLTFHYAARFSKMTTARGEQTISYTDYHKFQVDSRMVDDSPK